jgi:hypothetical protein
MRFNCLVLAILLLAVIVTINAFDALEIIHLGSVNYESSLSVFDSQGNVITVSRFYGPITLSNGVTLTPSGEGGELVLCKYSKDTLNLIWYKHFKAEGANAFGDLTGVFVEKLHVDENDFIYFGGHYIGTLLLDPTWQPLQTFDKRVGNFVAKFNSDGEAIVATQWIGGRLDLNSITTHDGNYFIAGTTYNYLYDGGKQPGTVTNGPYRIGLDNADFGVFYGYYPNGDHLHFYGLESGRATDVSGKDYVFFGTTISITPTFSTSAFLTNSVGNWKVTITQSSGIVNSRSMVTDSQGNFYINLQTYQGTLSIQSPDGTVQVPTSAYEQNVVIKLSKNGDFEWAHIPTKAGGRYEVISLGLDSNDVLLVGGTWIPDGYDGNFGSFISKILPNGVIEYTRQIVDGARMYNTHLSTYDQYVTFGGDFPIKLSNVEHGIDITPLGSSDAFTAVAYLGYQDPPIEKTCPSGTTCSEACCEWKPPGAPSFVQTCYSQAIYRCTSDKADTTKKCLCPNGTDCCAGACFNPSVHVCTGGNLCPLGTVKCGASCYDPKIFKCCGGSTLKHVAQFC